MRRERSALVPLLMIFSIGFLVLIPTANAEIEPVLTVAVSIAPVAGMVEEVGGSYVETSILLSEVIEPHAFTIDASIIADVETADLLVITGHFEWEDELVNQTNTPFITMDREDALEKYEDYGARFSAMPGHPKEEDHNHFLGDENHNINGGANPHSWWLLPVNAIAISNATRAAFATLYSTSEDIWKSNFDAFVKKIEEYLDLVDSQDEVYHFSGMNAICVFPAEAYVAETFGIEVIAILQAEGITISGDELLEVQEAMRNGTVSLILGSDIARLQAGGNFAGQLIEDYGGTLIWWKAIFFEGFKDYLAIMSYNLGSLVSGLEERASSAPDNNIILILGGLSGILAIVVILEAFIIYKRLSA